MNKDHARKVVELLEKVLAGRLESGATLKQRPDIDTENDQLIEAAWHELSHFDNDWDIRKKDPEYEAAALERMRKNLEEIKLKYSL